MLREKKGIVQSDLSRMERKEGWKEERGARTNIKRCWGEGDRRVLGLPK